MCPASLLLLLEDLESVFLAGGGGVRVLARRPTILLQGALLGGELGDAAAVAPGDPRGGGRVQLGGGGA